MFSSSLIGRKKTRIYAGFVSAAALSAFVTSPAFADNNYTPAGTDIENTATATYDNPAGGSPIPVTSNKVSMTVDELLDVTAESKNTGPIIVFPGQTTKYTTFEITNQGNGPEVFNLTANASVTGNQFNPTLPTTYIYIDDGDGIFDPNVDQPVTSTPSLDPDQKVTIFVVSDIPTTATDGQEGKVELTATAATGTGNPGTIFTGQGAGGGDAVVGTTRAQATDDGTYQISAATVTLVKDQSVVDPWGGNTTVPGSVITYTITANISGTGTVSNLKIEDDVPTGTAYQAGTITYESAVQTDAVDGDAGSITSGTVLATVPTINLGTTSSTTTRTLTFKVKVQ